MSCFQKTYPCKHPGPLPSRGMGTKLLPGYSQLPTRHMQLAPSLHHVASHMSGPKGGLPSGVPIDIVHNVLFCNTLPYRLGPCKA